MMVEGGIEVRELDEREAKEYFDAEARALLGVTGEEFIRRWDAGEYAEDPRHSEIVQLEFMLPFVR